MLRLCKWLSSYVWKSKILILRVIYMFRNNSPYSLLRLSRLWRRSFMQRRVVRVSDISRSDHTFLQPRTFEHPRCYVRNSLGWQTRSYTYISILDSSEQISGLLLTVRVPLFVSKDSSKRANNALSFYCVSQNQALQSKCLPSIYKNKGIDNFWKKEKRRCVAWIFRTDFYNHF